MAARGRGASLGDRIDDGLAVDVARPPRGSRAPAARGRRPSRCPTRAASRPRPRSRRWPRGLARGRPRCSCCISGGASALLPAPARRRHRWRTRRRVTVAAACARGPHPRAEHRAQAPLAPEGRRARARRRARPRGRASCCPTWWATTSSTIASGPDRAPIPRPTPTRSTSSPRAACSRGRPGGRARHLEAGARGRPCRRRPSRATRSSAASTTRVIGSNRRSVDAAAREARRAGPAPAGAHARAWRARRARSARALVAILRECVETGRPARPAGVPAGRRGDDGHRARATGAAAATRRWRWPRSSRWPLSRGVRCRQPGHRRHRRRERRGRRRGRPARPLRARARLGPGPARGLPGRERLRERSWARSATYRDRAHGHQRGRT